MQHHGFQSVMCCTNKEKNTVLGLKRVEISEGILKSVNEWG